MLCLPMQRMLKYPLLLKELRKSTPPTHPEHGPLGGALEAIQELARYSLVCSHFFQGTKFSGETRTGTLTNRPGIGKI